MVLFDYIIRSEEHTSELQSPCNLVCRLLLEKKKEKRLEKLPATEELFHIEALTKQASGDVRPDNFFFFNDTATPEIYPLPLHDAFPISRRKLRAEFMRVKFEHPALALRLPRRRGSEEHTSELQSPCNLVCRLLLEQ